MKYWIIVRLSTDDIIKHWSKDKKTAEKQLENTKARYPDCIVEIVEAKNRGEAKENFSI